MKRFENKTEQTETGQIRLNELENKLNRCDINELENKLNKCDINELENEPNKSIEIVKEIEAKETEAKEIEDKKFYFKIKNKDRLYHLNYENAKKVELFKRIIDSNMYYDKNNTVELTEMYCGDIIINTENVIEFIYEYLTKFHYESADDIMQSAEYKVENIGSDVASVIRPSDLSMINKFIATELCKLPNQEEIKNSETLRKKNIIKILNPLLYTSHKYLGIESLSKKLIIYIAILLKNCSLAELSEVANIKNKI